VNSGSTVSKSIGYLCSILFIPKDGTKIKSPKNKSEMRLTEEKEEGSNLKDQWK
jgi:hypothetical protein